MAGRLSNYNTPFSPAFWTILPKTIWKSRSSELPFALWIVPRQYTKRRVAEKAIGADLTDAISTTMTQVVNLDKSAAAETVATKTPVETEYQLAAISMREDKREDKNEIIDGGSDPSPQICLSYSQFWAQPDVCPSNFPLSHGTHVQEQTRCPISLLAFAGPWFAILGAIWTDKIVVLCLTDYVWMGNDTVFNEPSTYRDSRSTLSAQYASPRGLLPIS